MIGDQSYICRNVEFSVPRGGELILENGVFVGRGCIISAHSRVQIGAASMLGEYVCIHDNDHKLEPRNVPIAMRGFVSQPLHIGTNSWIGAGAVLVRGSGMGNDCVLGAGAVLTKVLPDAVLAVGVPAASSARPHQED